MLDSIKTKLDLLLLWSVSCSMCFRTSLLTTTMLQMFPYHPTSVFLLTFDTYQSLLTVMELPNLSSWVLTCTWEGHRCPLPSVLTSMITLVTMVISDLFSLESDHRFSLIAVTQNPLNPILCDIIITLTFCHSGYWTKFYIKF